jgi:hypothetical protein
VSNPYPTVLPVFRNLVAFAFRNRVLYNEDDGNHIGHYANLTRHKSNTLLVDTVQHSVNS